MSVISNAAIIGGAARLARGAFRKGGLKPPPGKPTAQAGFGALDVSRIAEAIKKAFLSNDPRQLNQVQGVFQSLPEVTKALILRNAGLDNPQSAMAAGQTPEQLAELLGAAIRDGDKASEAGARAYQDELSQAILGGQRSPQQMGALDREVATLDRKMQGDAWFPAREAQRDAAFAGMTDEAMKPGGGIPTRAPELDRLRTGITTGFERDPLELAPRDVEALRRIILEPGGAKEAARLIESPVKPWISDGERKAINMGAAGLVGGGTVAAAILGEGVDQDLLADSLSDNVKRRAETGEAPMDRPEPPMLGQRGPYEVLPDGLMPTANPAEPPVWLNGHVKDTIIRAQQRLSALGYAPMKQGNGERFDDGNAGSQTRTAVAAFQRDNKLPVSGDLDPITLRALLLNEANYGPEPVVVPRGSRALADAIAG